MKRQHIALLVSQTLLFGLMITFIFADMMFDLTGILRTEGDGLSSQTAFVAACLVGIVGAINVWLTWYYIQKSNAMRDWLVVCAWTHRVKWGGKWLSFEEFLMDHLGYNVSHGLSSVEVAMMRDELDAKWAQVQIDLDAARQTERASGSVRREGGSAGSTVA